MRMGMTGAPPEATASSFPHNVLKCPYCKYFTFVDTSLRKHILTHTREKPYMCSVCSFSLTTKASLQKHMRTHTGEKPYACTVCSYRSARKDTLNTHMLTHKKFLFSQSLESPGDDQSVWWTFLWQSFILVAISDTFRIS